MAGRERIARGGRLRRTRHAARPGPAETRPAEMRELSILRDGAMLFATAASSDGTAREIEPLIEPGLRGGGRAAAGW